MATFELWGDGAVQGNGTPEATAGWGTLFVVDGNVVREMNGHLPPKKFPPYQSNNTGELMAIIKGLEQLTRPYTVDIYSDSQYVIKGATLWHKNWIKNGWVNANGEKVANRKLWELLLDLASPHDIIWHHVKGHSEVEWNERCDQLAKMGVKKELVDTLHGHFDVVLSGIPIYTPEVIVYDEEDDVDF